MIPRASKLTVEKPSYFNVMAVHTYKLNPFCRILDKVLSLIKVKIAVG
jgi:hypothetical protein